MNAKKQGDKQAGPQSGRQILKQEKKQQGVGDVKDKAGEMMSGGVQTIKLAIQHVGKPSHWMPVARMEAKGPFHGVPRESLLHEWILRHIILVIKIDKIVSENWNEGRESDDRQGQTDKALRRALLKNFIRVHNVAVSDNSSVRAEKAQRTAGRGRSFNKTLLEQQPITSGSERSEAILHCEGKRVRPEYFRL
ncbi:MAG: hypothetical protein ABSA45_11910 [Verrucomicrobiota bacterium]